MALAAWGGDTDIAARNCCPVGLVQVLAYVVGVLMVGRMSLYGLRPVVCRPENLDACGARAGAPSAEAGEQVDCCGHVGASGACQLQLCFSACSQAGIQFDFLTGQHPCDLGCHIELNRSSLWLFSDFSAG